MLNMLAAITRKDYVDRRKRQAQGIQKAKLNEQYQGRPNDVILQDKISALLEEKLQSDPALSWLFTGYDR